MHVMSSSPSFSSPDRPVDRSSDDQDKPATTNGPEPLGHEGWVGWSDPMSRSVYGDAKVVAWHTAQAGARAMQSWAEDPRREAWVPVAGAGEAIAPDVQFDFKLLGTEQNDHVRIRVHLKPYMLFPDWDVPAHPATWLVEVVDGPVAGAMHTIPRPAGTAFPPACIEKRDPAGGSPLPCYLHEVDAINGIARYTASRAMGALSQHDMGHPAAVGARGAAAGPGGAAL
jgi:hypothetical protein